MNHASHSLTRHGLAMILIGLILGLVYLVFLLGALDLRPLPIFVELSLPGSERGWRVAHIGALVNGIFAIVLGYAVERAQLSNQSAIWAARFLIFAIWANLIFYLLGNIAPNHGLSWEGNRFGPSNWAGILAYSLAAIGSLTSITGVFIILKGCLGSARRDQI